MEQLNLITNFLRIKDKNITITDEYDMGTHLELHGHLDYTAPKCPKCKGQMAKYDYQKTSKIPYLETAGYPLLIRLRKRRFKCKNVGKWRSLKLLLSRKTTKSLSLLTRRSLNYSLKIKQCNILHTGYQFQHRQL